MRWIHKFFASLLSMVLLVQLLGPDCFAATAAVGKEAAAFAARGASAVGAGAAGLYQSAGRFAEEQQALLAEHTARATALYAYTPPEADNSLPEEEPIESELPPEESGLEPAETSQPVEETSLPEESRGEESSSAVEPSSSSEASSFPESSSQVGSSSSEAEQSSISGLESSSGLEEEELEELEPAADLLLDALTLPVADSYAGGSGTAADPFLIADASQLALLAQQVNGGTNHSGKYFRLTGDIAINDVVEITTWEDGSVTASALYQWMPIGANGRPFAGSFDGGGHRVSGLYIDVEADYVGLFGYATGTLQNVSVVDSFVRGNNYVGSLAGTATVINSVSNNGFVIGDDYVGGISGSCYVISNCSNGVDIKGQNYVGGLVGHLVGENNIYRMGTINNSFNTGNVQGANQVGGLAGRFVSYNITHENTPSRNNYNTGTVNGLSKVGGIAGEFGARLYDSYNTGIIIGADYVGGIGGYLYSVFQITDCENRANVTATAGSAGGFIGGGPTTNSINVSTIDGVVNSGNVSATTSAGGFIGNFGAWPLIITDSHNTGSVSGKTHVGGLVGNANTKTTISGSTNEGNIAGNEYIGGIVGYNNATISNSKNIGLVSGENYIGGFIGYTTKAIVDYHNASTVIATGNYAGGVVGYTTADINSSSSSVSISGNDYVGGVVGYSGGATTGCTFTGATVSGNDYVGGLAGFSAKDISGYHNEAVITATGDYVGGVVGRVNGTLTDCSSSVAISAEGRYVGGLAGYVSNSMIECEFTGGSVSGGSYVGGYAGYVGGSLAQYHNVVPVTGSGDYVGGIAGYLNGSLSNSSNSADIRGDSYVGGLAGHIGGALTNCYNLEGMVVGSGSNIGGLAGQSNGAVTTSYNEGGLVQGRENVGGLIGSSAGKIEYSYNAALVSGVDSAGGLAGIKTGNAIEGSYNTADITASGNRAGGLVGTQGGAITIHDSLNQGSVLGDEGVGGIVGGVQTGARSATISYVTNEGEVRGYRYVGGIAGQAAASIEASENKGAVYGYDYLGGIGGHITGTIKTTYNAQILEGRDYVGGIAGYATSVLNCVNQARVKGRENVGGIAGYKTLSIEGSHNQGPVEGSTHVGGIVGQSNGSVRLSANTGIVDGFDHTGGVAGLGSGISNSFNSATINGGSMYTGGVVGRTSGSILDVFNRGQVSGQAYTGGIVGYGNRLTNAYSTGYINSFYYDTRGGLAGRISSINNSYFVRGQCDIGIGNDYQKMLDYEKKREESTKPLEPYIDPYSVRESTLQGYAGRLGAAWEATDRNTNDGFPILKDIPGSAIGEIGSQYGIFPLTPGDVSVYVLDASNPKRVVEGADVTLAGIGEETTDKTGRANFEFEGSYNDFSHLDIQREGYRIYRGDIRLNISTDRANVWDNAFYTALMTPLRPDDGVRPYVSTLMYTANDKTIDTLTVRAEPLGNETVVLNMNAVWNDAAPGRYVLFQENGRYVDSNNGFFRLRMIENFLEGEKIYAQVITADGVASDAEEVLIEVVEPFSVSEVGWFTMSSSDFDMGDTLDELEKILLEKGLEGLGPAVTNIPVSFEREGYNYIMYIGLSSIDDSIKETIRKGWDGTPFESLISSPAWGTYFSMDIGVRGFFELGTKPNDTHIGGGVHAFLKGDVHTPELPWGPVYVVLGGGFDSSISASARYYLNTGRFELDAPMKMAIKLYAQGCVGVPNVFGVGLQINVGLPTEISPRLPEGAKMDLLLSGGLVLRALGHQVFERNVDIAQYEIYPGNYNSSSRSAVATPFVQEQAFTLQPEIMPREYMEQESEWQGGTRTLRSLAASSQSTERVLQTNVYPDAKPQIVAIGDKQVAVWLQDDPARTAINRTLLVYSVYDSGTGVWSAPQAIFDDGTADFYPNLVAAGGQVYVTWQNIAQAFADTVDFDTFAKASDIMLARFDLESGTFTDAVTVSDSNTLDMLPAVAVSDAGEISVIWLKNTQNDLFGFTGETEIWAWNSTTQNAARVQAGLGSVITYDARYGGNSLQIAYCVDMDGNSQTIDDLEVFTLTPGAGAQQVTNNQVADSNPVYAGYKGGNALFWYSDGNILARLANGQVETVYSREDGSIGDQFTVLSGGNGYTMLVWTAPQETGSFQLVGMAFDPVTAQWSKVVTLSDSSADIQIFDGAVTEDGTFKILYLRTRYGDDLSQLQSDLCLLEFEPSYDLALDGVYYDPSDEMPGQVMDMTLLLSNRGLLPIDTVTFTLDGQQSTVSVAIQPGETATVTVPYTVPASVERRSLIAHASIPGEIDRNPANNLAGVELGYADASLRLEEMKTGEQHIVNLMVANESAVPAEIRLQIRAGSEDGDVLDTLYLGMMDRDSLQQVQYIIRQAELPAGCEIVFFVLETDEEEFYYLNNTGYVVLDWAA